MTLVRAAANPSRTNNVERNSLQDEQITPAPRNDVGRTSARSELDEHVPSVNAAHRTSAARLPLMNRGDVQRSWRQPASGIHCGLRRHVSSACHRANDSSPTMRFPGRSSPRRDIAIRM